MKIVTLILLLFFVRGYASGQSVPEKNYNDSNMVRGIVADVDSVIKLRNTSVLVLRAEDSILVKFTYAAANGSFNLDGLPNGKFLLLLSYPGYADYVEEFSLTAEKRIHEFGLLKIIPKTKLLQEVIVKGQINLLRVKGDTTEYRVKNFKIQPNAKVEDLLKQLPGIQIDNEGRITAQGQQVKKVLVDGEEFFGDDPTLVTRNIRADMIDKVQVYDKSTDKSVLTGIADGNKEKTINLQLKEDKKNGYFGKVEAGVGTNGFYTGQAMLNSFKGKRKFSVYGLAGNDGKTGLGWLENAKYASSNVDMSEPGVIIDMGGDDELESFDGRYNGQGIPVARNGGVHYDNKWNSDKNALNFNYKIGSLVVEGNSNAFTLNNLPGNAISVNGDQNFRNRIFRQKADARYQIRIDSSSEIKISVDGTLKKVETENNYTSAAKNGSDLLLNNELRGFSSSSDNKLLNTNVFYSKKFKKPGRTLSVNLLQMLTDRNADGFLKSRINFYDANGAVDSTQLIDQYKKNITMASDLHGNIEVSEALSKSVSAIFNYGIGYSKTNSDRNSFNKSAGGKYDVLDTAFSNSFELKQLYNQFGTFINYGNEKNILNFGTKVSTVNFRQFNKNINNLYNRNFIVWYPQVNWQHRFSQGSFLKANYAGNTIKPNADQLQPVRSNNNPLNITVGNPDLKPAFANRLFMAYQSINPVKGRLIGVFVNTSITTRAIIRSLDTDSLGRSVNKAVNLTGKNTSNLNFSFFYDTKIKKLNLDAGVNFSADYNTYYALSNKVNNRLKFNTYTLQFRGGKAVANKYEFNFAFGPSYVVSGSSLLPDIDNNGKGFAANGGFTVYLPAAIQLSSNVNYQYNESTGIFSNGLSRTILNASINKSFLKERSLKLSLSGNDLLNQNIGFSRNVDGFLLNQNSFTTIRRYFMLSLIFDFSKMGKNN